MADNSYVRLKSKRPGSVGVVLVSGTTTTGYVDVSQGLMVPRVGRVPLEPMFSTAIGGTHRNRLIGEQEGVRELQRVIDVVGTSRADFAAKFQALQREVRDVCLYGGTMSERAVGATRFVHHDLVRAELDSLDSHLAAVSNRQRVTLAVAAQPGALTDPWDIADGFDGDTVNGTAGLYNLGGSDWTFRAGSSSNAVYNASQDPSAIALTGAAQDVRMTHTGAGNKYEHLRVEARFRAVTLTNGAYYGVMLKYVDANNYIRCVVEDNATANPVAKIYVKANGVETGSAPVTLTSYDLLAPFWVAAWLADGKISMHVWRVKPQPGGGAGASSVRFTSANGWAAYLGRGITGEAGVCWNTASVSNSGWCNEVAISGPYLAGVSQWASYNWPEVTPPFTPGGDLKALLGIGVAVNDGSVMKSAVLGWAPDPAPYSRITSTDGYGDALWSTAAVAGVNAAPTSLGGGVAASPFGDATSGYQIVTPGSAAGEGVNNQIAERFKEGVTYTFETWVYQASGSSKSLVIYAGSPSSGSSATNTVTVPNATWTKMSVAWVPTVNVDNPYLAIITSGTQALTFQVYRSVVYEGTVAPASPQGGVLPFGPINAAAASSFAGGSVIVGGGTASRSGRFVRFSAANSSATITWLIHPWAMAPDDFGAGSLLLDVYGMLSIAQTSVIATLSAQPEYTGARTMYGMPAGSSGLPLVGAITSAGMRPYFLGTVAVSADRSKPVRWQLNVALSWLGTGNLDVDYLFVVPNGASASTFTGVADDSAYPRFMAGSSNVRTKYVASDLTGQIRFHDTANQNLYPDAGLRGAQMVIPPGPVRLAAWFPQSVIDESGSTANQTAAQTGVDLSLSVQPRVAAIRAE